MERVASAIGFAVLVALFAVAFGAAYAWMTYELRYDDLTEGRPEGYCLAQPRGEGHWRIIC